MANKLKDIFSGNEPVIIGKLTFENSESLNQFYNVLEQVSKDGKTHSIPTIKEMRLGLKDGASTYPLSEHHDIVNSVVGPSIASISLPVLTENGEKIVNLQYTTLDEKIVFYNNPQRPFSYRFELSKDFYHGNFSYSTDLTKASTIEDLLTDYENCLDLMNMMKISTNDTEHNYKRYLANTISYFKQLQSLEKLFNVQFQLAKLVDVDVETEKIIRELYYLLCDHVAVKRHEKLNYISQVNFPENSNESEIAEGVNMVAAFLQTMNVDFLGAEIQAYLANFVFNCRVSKIDDAEDQRVIYFVDADEPMYISRTGFLTQEEAEDELKQFTKNQKMYENAKTLKELMNTNSVK